jgi:hypothetical protein
MVGKVVHGRLQTVTLQQLQSSRNQSLSHLRTIKYIQIEQTGVMGIEQHMGHKAQSLHHLALIAYVKELDTNPIQIVGQVEHYKYAGDHQKTPGQLEVGVAQTVSL